MKRVVLTIKRVSPTFMKIFLPIGKVQSEEKGEKDTLTWKAFLCNGPVVWINLIKMSFRGDNRQDADKFRRYYMPRLLTMATVISKPFYTKPFYKKLFKVLQIS